MKPPRLPIFLYATAVLALSLTSLFFSAIFIVPKLQANFFDLHQEQMLPGVLAGLFSIAEMLPAFFWPAIVLFVLVVAAGLLRFLPEAVGAVARVLVIACSVVALAMALGLFLALQASHDEVITAQKRLSYIYAQALEEFSLKEAADGRFEDFQRQIAGLSLQPVEIKSAAELGPSDQRYRLRQLTTLLQRPGNPEGKKQLLATSWMLREAVMKDPDFTKAILASANEQTGQHFQDVAAFYAWLEPSLGQGDWKPAPIYRFGNGR